ncbi:SDR family oxidoreductase [Staphylospora marina]|uniref:SDR family oxidoreductase n=1 Tax=Staphylospora marina TaxID=2490858 RepID=UPI000F5BD49C|nr:SDR family oxidoreductase [Staphylospora marina]
MKNLHGKTAIVTGASSGIGEATALALADAGVDVAITARRADRLKRLADRIRRETGVRTLEIPADVTDKEAMVRLASQVKSEWGRIDILVNNAGVMLLSFLEKNKVEEWERMVDVNIKGVLYGIHAVLPVMLEQGSGHIVNISSDAGHEVFPSSSVYSATKFAVRAISAGIAQELTPKGIRVTNVSPGAVATELVSHVTDRDVLDMFAQSPVVLMQPDDIARAVVYAVSQPEHVNVNEMMIRPSNIRR